MRIVVVILLRPETLELNNLRNVTAKIPKGVLTVVTDVAGRGKSSLIHGCLVPLHPDAVVVDQALTPGSRRSNLATYSGMANAIRRAFATANKVQPGLFSANSNSRFGCRRRTGTGGLPSA
jgi:excinuclease UvrABC ATPase subunit